MAFSEDGKILISATQNDVKLWELDKSRCDDIVMKPSSQIYDMKLGKEFLYGKIFP